MTELVFENFLVSTDTSKLQVEVIHRYLSEESYWAQHIPLKTLQAAISGSICFGIYTNQQQIGFARLITDGATFAYLADVFILSDFRGKGLSKVLMRFIMSHDSVQGVRRFMLATKDAHGLYSHFGFKALAEPARFMEIKAFENYSQ